MVSVPVNYPTDFASIPRIVWLLLPWWAKFNKASVLHDWLYFIKKIMDKPITRKQADDLWLEAMLIDFRLHRHGRLIAYVEYYAVRTFAWSAWRKRRQLR